ncbi:MAG: carboxylating nicotinate-nucleotide diphosphorylase [Deltaproteobacteria bacterium]|nr:carboxylating nicotinate-nucleotide diphosphorylase [Deltaproteobacteria bacterium]
MYDFVDRLIALALEEDLGSAGDVTSQALVPSGQRGRAELLAKERLVLAGTDVVRRTFLAVDPTTEVDLPLADGAIVERGRILGSVSGPLRSILIGERTALNFLQRLSGVATAAAGAAAALEGTRCRVLDTRKTTPGWRVLEKAAVRAGGGTNHRFGLFDGVLIKDNHIAAVGSIAEAVRRARAAVHHLMKVEVEVVDLAGVAEAVEAAAEVLLLDNMDTPTMRRAVQLIAGRALTEASGGITLERLREVADAGVDYVSMGALTHSARGVDISLEVRPGA